MLDNDDVAIQYAGVHAEAFCYKCSDSIRRNRRVEIVWVAGAVGVNWKIRINAIIDFACANDP